MVLAAEHIADTRRVNVNFGAEVWRQLNPEPAADNRRPSLLRVSVANVGEPGVAEDEPAPLLCPAWRGGHKGSENQRKQQA